MKRPLKARLMFALLSASLILVSAHVAVNAAPEPMNFMTTDGSYIDPLPSLGSYRGAYDFNLFNRTTGWVLNGFYTKQNGKWSANWLPSKVKPGKDIAMKWSAASDKGDCVVPFKVTWDDYDKPEIYSVDWC